MLCGGVAACQGMVRVLFAVLNVVALNTANSTRTITWHAATPPHNI